MDKNFAFYSFQGWIFITDNLFQSSARIDSAGF